MIIDCHNHLGVDLRLYMDSEFPYAQQLANLTQQGKALGITHWVVFPFVSYIGMEGSFRSQNNLLHQVPYAFENRRMLEECYCLFSDEGRRTLPFVMVDPMRHTNEQATELLKLKSEYRFHGIKIQSTMIKADIKYLRNEGSVFLDIARLWNVPFLIHSSVAKSDQWAQAHDILDIAEENLDIRFCLAHSCRFDKECLDRVNALPNTWFDNSAHCIHCRGAVEDLPYIAPYRRRFDTDYTNPGRVLADLATAYPDKLMWGSDSPFYSFVAKIDGQIAKLVSTYEQEVGALKTSSPDVIERISVTNTLNYLKLSDESILS